MQSPTDKKENPGKLYTQAKKCTLNTTHVIDVYWANVQIFTQTHTKSCSTVGNISDS